MIHNLKIKIFADGADKAGMLDMYAKPFIQGLTTNPTLMAKVGIKDYEKFSRGSGNGLRRSGRRYTPDAEQIPPDGLSEIEAPFPLPDDAIASQVEGTSMWPRYDFGDIIIVRAREGDPESLLGLEVALKTKAGQRYLKRVLKGTKRGLYDLESHNAETIRNAAIEWVSEVHVVRVSGANWMLR